MEQACAASVEAQLRIQPCSTTLWVYNKAGYVAEPLHAVQAYARHSAESLPNTDRTDNVLGSDKVLAHHHP